MDPKMSCRTAARAGGAAAVGAGGDRANPTTEIILQLTAIRVIVEWYRIRKRSATIVIMRWRMLLEVRDPHEEKICTMLIFCWFVKRQMHRWSRGAGALRF
jgi:hypothetical protein